VIASKSNTNIATDVGDTYSVSATARYLRVNMTYNSANIGVHISDFRVYGIINSGNNSYTISASAGAGGTVSPAGTVTLNQGSNQTYIITANSGYHITDVKIDNISVGTVSTYTFNNITANHTISATFSNAVNTYTISSSAGAGGSINPTGTLTLDAGSNQIYTVTANSGYLIEDVKVDNVSIGAVSDYTFTNVIANHTIAVSFLPVTLSNIALNKPSSCQSYEYNNVPSQANDADGTNNSYWAANPYSKWWKVDLGNIYDISSIVIRNYVDNNRYYQYTIEASLDDITYTVIASKSNTNIATDVGDTYSVSATARYLRVNMTYNSANIGVHISDFRVYGSINGAKGTSIDQPSFKQSIIADSSQQITIHKDFNVNIYPNPFKEEFTIRIDSPDEEFFDLSILNLTGKKFYSRSRIPSNEQTTINEPVIKGIYFLILSNKEKRLVYRIVKY
jgi:hypothetical protein